MADVVRQALKEEWEDERLMAELDKVMDGRF